uniref:SCO family protein n=1 Tax=Algoriphagus sp. TaxID=1872435 RepID=UPI0025D77375
MKFKLSISFITLFTILLWQCKPAEEEMGPLPILGNFHVDEIEIEGKILKDTVYHKIADFAFVNQDGDTISNSDVAGKVYVADFFFTSCPTICPIMKKEMLRVYETYGNN